jgi:hypothetical protein
MITFTDPVNTIPPLCEDDINTKYILSIYNQIDIISIWIASLKINRVGWSSISSVLNGCSTSYSKNRLIDILICDYKTAVDLPIKPYYVVVEPNEIVEFLLTFNDRRILKNFKAFLELHPTAPDSDGLLRQLRDRNIRSST